MQLMRLNSFWFDNPLIRLVLVSCFVVGMQGCASVPKTKPDSAVSQQQYQLHQASLKTIVQFALTGRIGVQTNGKGFSGVIGGHEVVESSECGFPLVPAMSDPVDGNTGSGAADHC